MDGDITIVAVMIPFGLTLLGLGAYMYDQLQKDNSKHKYDNNIFKTQMVIYLIPFVFLKRSIKNKSKSGIIIFTLFWIIVFSWMAIVITQLNK